MPLPNVNAIVTAVYNDYRLCWFLSHAQERLPFTVDNILIEPAARRIFLRACTVRAGASPPTFSDELESTTMRALISCRKSGHLLTTKGQARQSVIRITKDGRGIELVPPTGGLFNG